VAQAPGITLKVAIGGGIPGFVSYEEALAGLDPSDIDDAVLGNQMLYTSGTTGRPKGVYRAAPVVIPQAMYALRGYDEHSVQLCAGPAYHAAPLAFDVRGAMGAGATLVFMDKWDSEHTLRTIAERRVTHMHLVPIMFQRLLALPAEVKARYDISSVIYIIHGAAPCPPEVKHAMIEWFGPVISEYYAGSEGGAGFMIDSHEWLQKPGSVGKRPVLLGSKILDEHGDECPPNVSGTIYHQLPPGGAFTYYKDEKKTQASRVGDYFTMGDMGYFDDDGYLFLTGRSAETIISGGVNIYPQEVDNELIKHDAVADSATVGVPHDEWGEQVKAVILLKPGYQPSDLLANEILAFARDSLPAFKVPRSLDFVAELPRSEAGKIQRNKVRAPYWEGRARQI
jgi:long-chain acyl-CoA synthetase